MTIQFEKKLDVGKVNDAIQKRIESAELNFKLWKVVQSALLKFEGKTISKRIETEIKKLLPDNTIYYDNNYGMYHIVIWGNGIKYDNRLSFLLGYANNPIVDGKKILDHNLCHELEEGRANKLKTITLDMIVEKVNTWNQGLEMMQSVNKWADGFEISYYGFDIEGR